jgi:26S proteasome regulatory subunit N3
LVVEDKTKSKADPEIFIYFSLLVMIYLLDIKEYKEGLSLATTTVGNIKNLNRRTLDSLASYVYFYYARFHELTSVLRECRSNLLSLLRTATLRHDEDSQVCGLVNYVGFTY